MNLPTGLVLRPEFRPQHDKGKEAPAGKTSAPPPSTEQGQGTTQQKGSGQPPASPCGAETLPMIALLLIVFYFFLLRPQQKQEKQLKEMRAGLKKGDHIVTSSGMHAVVTHVDDAVVTVKPSADGPDMKFDVSAIGRVVSDDGGSAKAG